VTMLAGGTLSAPPVVDEIRLRAANEATRIFGGGDSQIWEALTSWIERAMRAEARVTELEDVLRDRAEEARWRER